MLLPLLPPLILRTSRIYIPSVICTDYIRFHYCGLEILLLYQSLRDIVKFTYVYVKIFTRFKFLKSFKDASRPLRDRPRREALRVQITQKTVCCTWAIYRNKTGRSIFKPSEEMFSCWEWTTALASLMRRNSTVWWFLHPVRIYFFSS